MEERNASLNNDRPHQTDVVATAPEERQLVENLCGDLGLRIARDGTWYYRNSPIARKPLVKLFASVLRRDDLGDYWLITPAEKGRIVVEDVPFIAVEATVEGVYNEQVVRLRTNLDDIVTVDAAHPLRVVETAATRTPQPYVLVRHRLEARLVRAVYYDLVERGVERMIGSGRQFGIWSSGQFFALGSLDDPA